MSGTVADEGGAANDENDTDLNDNRSKSSPALTVLEDVEDGYESGQDDPMPMTVD